MDDTDVMIGKRQLWGGEQPFGLSPADRRQHCYVIGQTGTGKSTLLKRLVLQDLYAGRGVAVLDPHGDLAEDILDYYPPWRADDLLYFNPGDLEHPVAFNLLADVPPDNRHLVASGVVGALKSIWRDSFGPRMEYILYAAVTALLDCNCPNITLLSLQRMLSDDGYRRWVVAHLKDPLLQGFWLDEFAAYDERFRREAVAPIQNKVGQLLMAPPVRNIFGQVRSTISVPFMMQHRRVLIANLSKGLVGEDKSNLMGALLIAQLQQAALARSALPSRERTPFYVYVDEFQNFTTDAFASILSESRKYGLSLTLAHQYLDQTRPEIRDAVFGNVGNLVCFRVGEGDAAALSREFGHAFIPEQFTDLANHHVLVRRLVQEEVSDPFSGVIVPSDTPRHGRREKLVARSRERFTTPRAKVEDQIRRWMAR